MIPVVELLRVSTQAQAALDRTGLAAQHSTNERTCQQYGLHVVDCVRIVVSGAEVADTPEMARVLELVTSGRARGVVLAEYSRLLRPERWTDLRILQTFADHGANIYLPSGPLDLLSEAGFVSATVNNMVAALERRRIRERLWRGMEESRRTHGNTHGSTCLPVGVAYSKADGWSYTEDIGRVREVYRLYLGGERNMEEIGRRVGIARTSALYILQNPIYTGTRVFDKRRDPSPTGFFDGKKYRKTIRRAPDEVIRFRLPLEPVISESEFAAVQHILAERPLPRRTPSQHYLYRGYAECTCGQPLYGQVASARRYPYYLCRSMVARRCPADASPCGASRMRAELLDAQLDSIVSERLLDVGVLAPAIDAYNASIVAASSQYVPSRHAVAGLRQRRARVIGSYVDGAIEREERDRLLVTIDRQLAIAVEPVPEPAVLSADLVMELLQAFAEWTQPQMSREAKRNILAGLHPVFHVKAYEVVGVSLPIRASVGQRPWADPVPPLWIALVAA